MILSQRKSKMERQFKVLKMRLKERISNFKIEACSNQTKRQHRHILESQGPSQQIGVDKLTPFFRTYSLKSAKKVALFGKLSS